MCSNFTSKFIVISYTIPVPKKLYLSGGLGTALGRGDVQGEWSFGLLFKNPIMIKDACKKFVISGSDVIQTATYQLGDAQKYQESTSNNHENASSSIPSDKHSITRQVEIACELAHNIRTEIMDSGEFGWRKERRLFVLGCIGPIGVCLPGYQEYNGKYIDQWSDNDIQKFHKERVDALKIEMHSGKVDLLALETIPSIREASIVADMLHGVPFYVAMSCKDGLHTCYGDALRDLVSCRFTEYAAAIGVNCCRPRHVLQLLKSLKDGFTKERRKCPLLIAYANSGDSYTDNGMIKAVEGDKIISHLQEWIQFGVDWIGGCYGVDYEELNLIHRFIENKRQLNAKVTN